MEVKQVKKDHIPEAFTKKRQLNSYYTNDFNSNE